MIEFLFLDLDDTILDFHKAEGIAIRKTFSQLGIDPTDAVCKKRVQDDTIQDSGCESGINFHENQSFRG